MRRKKVGKKQSDKAYQRPEGAHQRRRTGGAQLAGAGGDAGGAEASEPENRRDPDNKNGPAGGNRSRPQIKMKHLYFTNKGLVSQDGQDIENIYGREHRHSRTGF